MKRTHITALLFFLGMILIFIVKATAQPVPDTGQTQCYNDAGNVITCPSPGQRFYGQDANYTINPMSFTKLDANGKDLPNSAISWEMVRDNVTGLIWEVKRNNDGVKNYNDPHDADNTYEWYDPNEPDYRGKPGDGIDTFDTLDFIDALNSSNFGGYSDWRLPAIKELAYTVYFSIQSPGPTINTQYFPNTAPYRYWSSTTFAPNTSGAWYVNFNNATSRSGSKLYMHYVRAVRSGNLGGRFQDNGNGTVTDTSTGLMWQKATAQGTYNWEEALAYCESSSLANYTDWRLPTIKELHSLVDHGRRYNPAINPTFFPDTVSKYYWSSSTHASKTMTAWHVEFYNGTNNNSNKNAGINYVRAVRGRQPMTFLPGVIMLLLEK